MRASTRAKINYFVDAAIAVAFVLLAASGLVFLLPSGWVSVSSGSAPAMLGVTLAVWRSIHDWSALVMFSGVVLHTALHWRWVVAMTKKTFAPAPVEVLPQRTASTVVVRHTAEATSPCPVPVAGRAGEDGPPRHTRHEVLVGVGMVTAAVVTGGLAGRALSRQWLESSDATSAAAAPDATSASRAGQESDGSATGSGFSAEAAPSDSLVADRVVVDQARCNGCGRCLPSCPYGVFGWSGSTAVAADVEACRLCGRCLQACPTAAITLNA